MMGAWLARLKNEKAPDPHATKPTEPPPGEGAAGFVGFVAYPPDTLQKIGAVDPVAMIPETPASNDGPPPAIAPATDPDRWCWPHSAAWDSKEIDTFTARLARFTDKGVTYDEAEQLANGLVNRDREGDDRRLCLECIHLQGLGRWRCANAPQADVAPEALAPALVLMLQRCNGFLGAGAPPNSCLPHPGGATNLPIDFGKSKPME